MSTNLLMIFARNPVKGKVKTRLASSIGEEQALLVYERLLSQTAALIKLPDSDIQIHYTDFIPESDVFNGDHVSRKLQIQGDLGERMSYAFENGFIAGYEKILIIGTDCPEITLKDIILAFDKLTSNDIVIGPALDGGYYLLGLKKHFSKIFRNKKWSTSSVYSDTLMDAVASAKRVAVLDPKRDIDTIENLQEFPQLLD